MAAKDITSRDNPARYTWKTDWTLGVADPSPAMTHAKVAAPNMTYDEAERMAFDLLRESGRTVIVTHGKYLYAHAPCRTLRPELHL